MPFDISSFSLTPDQLKKAEDIKRDPILSKIGTTGGIPYKSTDAYRFVNDPNRKMLGYDAFRNNEYVYDEAQTTGQWWKNTAMRALNPLTTSFAESFRYDKTFQQLFTDKSMSNDEDLKNYIKRTEDLNFLYPNYENADTKDGLLGYFSSGARNKWSNLLESSGFMIGTTLGAIGQTVALSALTGGGGAAPAAAEGISAIGNAARYSRVANSFNMLNRVNKLWQQTKASYIASSQLFQGIEGVQQVKNAVAAKNAIGAVKGAVKILGNGAVAYQRASSEAMLESIEGSEHFFKQQVQEKEQELGRPLTKGEKDEIQDYSADLFSARYKANVGVLMTTNLLQDYNLFSSFQKISKTARLAGIAEEVSKRQIYSKGLQKWVTAGALPMKEFVVHYGKQVGGFLVKNTLTEGLEESAQYAIDKSTNDYYTKKYNKEAVSFMDSVGKGVYSAINDKEGQESFWAGAVMGGLFSGIGAAGTKVAGMANGKNKMVAEMADANNDRLNKAQEDLLTLIKTEQVLSAETENATFNHTINDEIQNANDQETVTNLRKKVLVNAVKTAKEVGKYDVFMDNIKSLSELSEEDFKTKFEITDTATRPKSKEAYINELLQEATNIKNDLDMIDERYINPYQNYTSINPTKKPKERKEAFVKYKAWEEAKTVVLDNMANLRSTHKEVTENNTWFANKGVVAEDMISYIKEKSSPDRVEKIRSLTLDLDALHTVLSEKLPAKERADYVKQAKAIQKELDIYENLHSDPTNTKYRIALFNHLKKQNPDTPTILNSDKAFGEDLEIKLEQAVQAVDRNKQALEAIVALENSDIFSALAGNYEKRYNERYNIVVSDLEDGLTDAEKAAAQPTASELSPVTQEDVDRAMDSEGKDVAEYAIDTIARKQANNIPLTEYEQKLFIAANPAVKASIEAIKNQIEANIKREAERAKDPEAFDKKEKIAEVEKSHEKKTEKIKEEIAEKEAKIAEIESADPYARIDKVKSMLGHQQNADLFKKLLNILQKFAQEKPEHAKAIVEATKEKLSLHLVGGTTDPKRNSTARGDLDSVFLHQDDVDNPNSEFGKAVQALQYYINDNGNNKQQAAIESKLRPEDKSIPIDISDIVTFVLKASLTDQETIKNSEEQTINDKKTDIGRGRQEELENKVEELKDKRNALRGEDGVVPKENMVEWQQLGKDVAEAQNKATRGNNEGFIPIRTEKDGILSGKDAINAENEIERVIQKIIKGEITIEQAVSFIHNKYRLLANENAFLLNYINDRTSNAPEIGNNKQSFPAWRKGKYDAELKALEEQSTSAKKADIEIGKVGNTEYEVKVDGVYYQGKKLNNPENKTHRQLIEANIERRRQEELKQPIKDKLQEIEKAVKTLNITTDKDGKLEQTSDEIITNIKSELDKIGLPYKGVASNENGSSYKVITNDGTEIEVVKLLKSGGALIKPTLSTAKFINHLIKTEPQTLRDLISNQINTRYNAEIDELKNKKTTSTPEDKNKSVQDAVRTELPKEIGDAITFLTEVPEDILGRDDLYLSIKEILNDNNITDEILINWIGINKDSVGHPKNLKSEQQVLDLIQKRLKEKQKESNYLEFQKNPLALESFGKWKDALKDFPLPFQEIMLTHALKWMNNPDRRSKYVLQLSSVALQNAYGIVVNKPHELNRIGKLYDQEVLKTVSDAVEHEPSASGRGHWVHIPKTMSGKLNDWRITKGPGGKDMEWAVEYLFDEEGGLEFFDTEQEARDFVNKRISIDTSAQFKANVELLRKLSPSTWCTAGGMADHYVENYDNYLLIVDGVTVVGIEAKGINEDKVRKENRIEELESKLDTLNNLKPNEDNSPIQFKLGKVNEVFLYSGVGFDKAIEKYKEPFNREISQLKQELEKIGDKIQVKEVTSRANNGVASIEHLDDTIAFFEKHNLDLDNPSVKRAIELREEGKTDKQVVESEYTPAWGEGPYDGYDEEFHQHQEMRELVATFTDPESFLELAELDDNMFGYFDALPQQLRDSEVVARKAVEYRPDNIAHVSPALPFYNELATIAVTKWKHVFDYLPNHVQEERVDLREMYDAYRLEDLPFSKTNDNTIQGYYDARNDKVVLITSNTKSEEAPKVAIHEVAHRGMLRMAKDLGGETELLQVLQNAEEQLMEKLPGLLKRTGHTSLENLMLDYGFDKNSENGKFKLLQELAARWSETLVDKPKPTWWKNLLQNIGKWISKFTGKTLSEKEVDELVGGFVKYGTQNINKEATTVEQEDKTIEVKEGVEFVFEENPELANIGTQQQYSNYLDTIFPNSKVKDIVYHGTNTQFDSFDLSFEGTNKKGGRGKGLNFTKDLEDTNLYGDIKMAVLLNAQNKVQTDNEAKKDKLSYIDDVDELVVYNPEQIHILGSKQDIEGFKEFVNKEDRDTIPQKELFKAITEVKPGVQELFDSNPELANYIYESLGFKSKYKDAAGIGNLIDELKEIKEPYLKELADLFISLNIDIPLYYSKSQEYAFILSDNTIIIPKNSYGIIKQKSIIHELLHTGTSNKLLSNSNFKSEIESLIKTIKDSDKQGSLTFSYELQNADEFISGLSEKSFVNLLKQKGMYDNVLTLVKNNLEFKKGFQITTQQKQQAQQLYSQYLDTIFPDSKVKDIVYHHSDTKITEFKKEFPEGYAASKGVSPKAKFFLRKPLKEEFLSKRPYVGQYLINTVNPNIMPVDADRSAKRDSGIKEGIQEALDNNQDGAIFDNIWDNRTWSDVLVVFEPEQIHILGSKQDTERFEFFVKNIKNEEIPTEENPFEQQEPTVEANPELEALKIEVAEKEVELDVAEATKKEKIEKIKAPKRERTKKKAPKSFAGITDKELKDIMERNQNFSTIFSMGQVFRTSTGFESKKIDTKEVVNKDLSKERNAIAKIKHLLAVKERETGIPLNQSSGIFITLKRDSRDYYHEPDKNLTALAGGKERTYFSTVENGVDHPVVAVLTDKNGKDLFFDEKGDIAKEGYIIAEQVFEVLDTKFRTKKERIQKRAEQRGLAMVLDSYTEYTPEELKDIQSSLYEEVEKEFELLAKVKDFVRAGNTITISDYNVSTGFAESVTYSETTVAENKRLKSKRVELQTAKIIDLENPQKQTSGFAYIQASPQEKYILKMPHLKEMKALIEKLQTEIISPKGEFDPVKRAELIERRRFLLAILYKTVGPKTDSEEHLHNMGEGTQAAEESSTRGIANIRINQRGKQLDIVTHDNTPASELNLRVNVDRELLNANNEFVEFYLDKKGNVKRRVWGEDQGFYQGYLKSIAKITMPNNIVEDASRRYNVVFGFNPSETVAKMMKSGKAEMKAPILVKVTLEPVGLLTPQEQDTLNALGVSFKGQSEFEMYSDSLGRKVISKIVQPAKTQNGTKIKVLQYELGDVEKKTVIATKYYNVPTLIKRINEGMAKEEEAKKADIEKRREQAKNNIGLRPKLEQALLRDKEELERTGKADTRASSALKQIVKDKEDKIDKEYDNIILKEFGEIEYKKIKILRDKKNLEEYFSKSPTNDYIELENRKKRLAKYDAELDVTQPSISVGVSKEEAVKQPENVEEIAEPIKVADMVEETEEEESPKKIILGQTPIRKALDDGRKNELHREIKSKNLLKKGATIEDLLDSLVENNIVEKICKI